MGPGDQAFVRWVKRYLDIHDAKRVLVAYKKARLIAVDNRIGTFRVLDFDAVSRGALEAAAENLRPAPGNKWNRLSDEARKSLIEKVRPNQELWAKQERVELALLKLDAKRAAKKKEKSA